MTDDLDFSILDALTANQPATLPQDERERAEGCKEIPESTNALKTHSGASQGISNKADTQKRDRERAVEVYRAYQEAIKSGGVLMSEVTKGIINGVAPERLLLTACQIIEGMTGDTLFYEQNRENLKAIYGAGLLEPVPLQVELDDVRRRLAMLTRPELDAEPDDVRRRIRTATAAHEARAALLEARISAVGKTAGSARDSG